MQAGLPQANICTFHAVPQLLRVCMNPPPLLQEFLASAGSQGGSGPQAMPALSLFEAEISKFKATQEEIQVQLGCLLHYNYVTLHYKLVTSLEPTGIMGRRAMCSSIISASFGR